MFKPPGIGGRHQHEAGGIGQGRRRAADGDLTVLQRLAQHFQHVFLKFEQFVEKQHAVVRQGDFSRLG